MEDDKFHALMEKIEEFYFSEGEESGEEMFKKFAEKHADKFDEGFSATEGESKLE